MAMNMLLLHKLREERWHTNSNAGYVSLFMYHLPSEEGPTFEHFGEMLTANWSKPSRQ